MRNERNRCLCGARIFGVTTIDMSDGYERHMYVCGVCGTESVLKEDREKKLQIKLEQEADRLRQ